jgi:hypothetical protein
MTMTAYSANYTAADVSEAVIDNIVGILAALFGFASIVAVVLVYRFLKGKKTF